MLLVLLSYSGVHNHNYLSRYWSNEEQIFYQSGADIGAVLSRYWRNVEQVFDQYGSDIGAMWSTVFVMEQVVACIKKTQTYLALNRSRSMKTQ